MTTNPLLGVFKPPFVYNRNGSFVSDSANNRVVDVRGLARMTIEIPDTVERWARMDAIGQFIADLLNRSVEGELQQQQREAAFAKAFLERSDRDRKAREGDTNI